MVYEEILDRHPFNDGLYHIFRRYYDHNGKKKIRLRWCKQLNCFGIMSWFSDRIWVINGKITVLL